MSGDYTEDTLIEQPAVGLFRARDPLLPKLISGEVDVAELQIDAG